MMIIPGHIAGQRNVLADLASRKGQVLQSEFAMSRRSSSPDRSDGSDMAAGQSTIRVPTPVSHVEVSTAPSEGGACKGHPDDSLVAPGQVGTDPSFSIGIKIGTISG